MDAASLFQQFWPFAIVAAPGVWAVWKTWRASAEAQRKDRADLVKIAQDAAAAVIGDLRTDNDRLRERIAQIEDEFENFRRSHDVMIADKDAELAMLRGENRQLKALAEAYARLLEQNGIPHEKPKETFYRIPAGASPPREVEPQG